jgi:hypothetical protein
MFEYTITDRMNTDLRQLDALRDQLDLRGSLPRRWMGRLRRELQASSIAASTSMEGVRVTVEDVRRLMVGDVPSAVTPDDAALVQGYREAMEYVLKRADAPAFAWSPELLLALQDSVLAHSFARGAGRFRQTAVRVVDGGGVTRYEAPSSEAVPGLVDELVAWANAAAGVPTPVVSAMIHVGIAAIHPFSDGNGRTARVCAALAMLRGGYRAAEFTSLEEWWGSHLSAYYASFECIGRAWKSDSDVTPFLETHVAAQCAQAATGGPARSGQMGGRPVRRFHAAGGHEPLLPGRGGHRDSRRIAGPREAANRRRVDRERCRGFARVPWCAAVVPPGGRADGHGGRDRARGRRRSCARPAPWRADGPGACGRRVHSSRGRGSLQREVETVYVERPAAPCDDPLRVYTLRIHASRGASA